MCYDVVTPHAVRMLPAWQEQIRTTDIIGKHEHVVENILRDKADGWRHDYYRETSTGYDAHVGNAQAEVNKYKGAIKKYDLALDKITARLEASKKENKDPEFKKLTVKEAEALEGEYIELYKLKCEQLVLLDGAQNTLQGFVWKQYLQKKRLELLQWVRNNYLVDGDTDYMKRAVTYVEEYIERMRKTTA